jgi:MFS family permease
MEVRSCSNPSRDRSSRNRLAQVYYIDALGLRGRDGLLGLVNSAPYLCCAFSCWSVRLSYQAISTTDRYERLNYPLNKLLDRRGVIFLTCLISSITCLGQAFPQTWQQLFAARFLLGLGIGPKRLVLLTAFTFHLQETHIACSATIPIYAAEAAPANIRGALVMMWQMWTAFGTYCPLGR